MTWLPNQLFAVLEGMVEAWELAGKMEWQGQMRGCADVMEAAIAQKDTLTKEVEKYCQERGVDLKAQ